MLQTFEIGKKIVIKRKLEDQYFAANIQNLDQQAIYITRPYLGERPLILMGNEPVEVRYIVENGVLEFEANYLGTHKETESLLLYKISMPAPEDVKRIQLRNFVRVPVLMDVEYLLPGSEAVYQGTAVDLSAGGMKLATKHKLPVEEIITLYFKITKGKKPLNIQLQARVVRTERVETDVKLYHSGLQFLGVNRALEETLVRFVFKKQREQLRKL